MIPIAAAMVAIGLALIASPISFAETLGSDLVSAIGNVLIVFGVFASYVVVRAIEWGDRLSHDERTTASAARPAAIRC